MIQVTRLLRELGLRLGLPRALPRQHHLQWPCILGFTPFHWSRGRRKKGEGRKNTVGVDAMHPKEKGWHAASHATQNFDCRTNTEPIHPKSKTLDRVGPIRCPCVPVFSGCGFHVWPCSHTIHWYRYCGGIWAASQIHHQNWHPMLR